MTDFGYARRVPNENNGTSPHKMTMEERVAKLEAEREADAGALQEALREIRCLREKLQEKTRRRRTGDIGEDAPASK